MLVPATFTTERLVLRRLKASDASAVFAYGSDPEVAKFADWPMLARVEDAVAASERAALRWDTGEEYSWRMTVRPDDTAIGGVACSIDAHRAELGFLVARPLWGRGYATEAARVVVEWIQSLPNVVRIQATTDIDHLASARVLEKLGMSREVVLRRWVRRPNLPGQPVRDALLYAWVREAGQGLHRMQVIVAAFLSGWGALTSVCAAQRLAEHSSPGSLPRATRTGSSQDEMASIRQLWTDYVASKHGKFASNAGTASPLWLASERALWPMFDLAGFYVPDGAVLQSVAMQPTRAGGARAYEIVSRFSAAGAKPTDARSAIVLTMTVYSVRHEGRWVLANALPRKTAAWRREDVGQITYHVEPGLAFNRQKAQHAAAFVEPLVTAFAVPPIARLDYYVTSSVDEALRILGVEFPVRYGPNGGFSKPVNRQLFGGLPSLGEEYRHELTHVVLRPLLDGATMTILASEGVATWLGGTEGGDFRSGVRTLATYLAAHPDASLDAIMDSASIPQSVRYNGGAVLCAMLFDAGGTQAIKGFLSAGPGSSQLRAFLVRTLRRSWAAVSSDWRSTVVRMTST